LVNEELLNEAGRPDEGTRPGGPGFKDIEDEVQKGQIAWVKEQREDGKKPQITGPKFKVEGGSKQNKSKKPRKTRKVKPRKVTLRKVKPRKVNPRKVTLRKL